MSEKLPSVGAIRSGICQPNTSGNRQRTHPTTGNTHAARASCWSRAVLAFLGELLVVLYVWEVNDFTSERPKLAPLADKINRSLK